MRTTPTILHYHVIAGKYNAPPAIDEPVRTLKDAEYRLRRLINTICAYGNQVKGNVNSGYAIIRQLTTILDYAKILPCGKPDCLKPVKIKYLHKRSY